MLIHVTFYWYDLMSYVRVPPQYLSNASVKATLCTLKRYFRGNAIYLLFVFTDLKIVSPPVVYILSCALSSS